MPCPRCGTVAAALEGSTLVIAWYACASCGASWSARIRGGQPTDPVQMDVDDVPHLTPIA